MREGEILNAINEFIDQHCEGKASEAVEQLDEVQNTLVQAAPARDLSSERIADQHHFLQELKATFKKIAKLSKERPPEDSI
jgi:hypothetical protein